MKLYKLNWQPLLLGEHCYLDASDECYFADEYECRHRVGIKPLILSLKRAYEPVVRHAAQQVGSALPQQWVRACTFVPMPASSGTMSGVKSFVGRLPVEDIRDLLKQSRDTQSSHSGWRPTPAQRKELITLNELQVDPEPKTVVIVDDVLTTGSHFRAAKMVIRHRWPRMRVIGLFLARVCSRRNSSCYFDTANHGNGHACRMSSYAPLTALEGLKY